MQLFNELFNQCYCINLARRPDRWSRVSAEFKKLGMNVERVDAIDSETLVDWPVKCKAAEYACLLSHKKAIMKAYADGYDKFVIFEDDVTFNPMFHYLFNRWYRGVPEDWLVLHLGTRNRGEVAVITDRVLRASQFWGTHAVCMKRETVSGLLDKLNIAEHAYDAMLSWYCDNGRAYMFTEMLAWQFASYSDLNEMEYGGHTINMIKQME